tara:strand:- start:206 stop:481 length:276 start_codon:yes stop_codon:yes gene_type:complete
MKFTNQQTLVIFAFLMNLAAADMILNEENALLSDVVAKFYSKHSCKINYVRHYYNELFANQYREDATPIVSYACFCDETTDIDVCFGDDCN